MNTTLEQVGPLLERAKRVEREVTDVELALENKRQELANLKQQIGVLVTSDQPVIATRGPGRPAKNANVQANGVRRGPGRPPKNAAASAAVPKRRGRPPKNANVQANGVRRGPGRPPKNVAAASTAAPKRRGRPPKSVASSADAQKPANDSPLREVVWNVTSAHQKNWAKHNPERPENAVGYKVSELVAIIKGENLWESSSDEISQQVQNQIYRLKDEGKMVRGEDKRYSIAKGAELNGPKLT